MSIYVQYDNDAIKLLDAVQFSLYGCSDDEYKNKTGRNNGFSCLKKSIEMIKKKNISFEIAFTANEETMDSIEKYIITTIDLGVSDLI